jgi:hypothetical protein
VVLLLGVRRAEMNRGLIDKHDEGPSWYIFGWIGFHQISPDFTRFQQISPDFTRFQQISPDFTRFPGFPCSHYTSTIFNGHSTGTARSLVRFSVWQPTIYEAFFVDLKMGDQPTPSAT